MNKTNEGQLQVWWIPQVPMEPFTVDVPDVKMGALLLDAFADYDLFQLKHNVKPDYSNAGGLRVFHDGEWEDWFDEETGEDDPREFVLLLGHGE